MSSKIALFIDAENISYRNLPDILAEIPRHGDLVLRALYGDWEASHLQSWRDIAEPHDFKFRYHANPAKTKNASDIKLIIDVMEVLYVLPMIDIFCLVTSDADFVPLCNKLHEAKKQIIGFGARNAAEALIRSCDKFVFIKRAEESTDPTLSRSDLLQLPPPRQADPLLLRKLIAQALAKTPQDSNGWATFLDFREILYKTRGGFQTATYGYKSLAQLLLSMPELIECRIHEYKIALVRLKDSPEVKSLNPHPEKLPLQTLVSNAFEKIPWKADGWVLLSALGEVLGEIQPGYKKIYGYSDLTKFLESMPDCVELRGIGGSKAARLKS